MIMQAVGVAEDNIFKKRKEDDVRFARVLCQNHRIQSLFDDVICVIWALRGLLFVIRHVFFL